MGLKYLSAIIGNLDFNETLYAQKITIEFAHYLRGMMKFNGLEELKTAMKADENNANRC
jgi:riboflavin kinase/FMN adenylyltransferase